MEGMTYTPPLQFMFPHNYTNAILGETSLSSRANPKRNASTWVWVVLNVIVSGAQFPDHGVSQGVSEGLVLSISFFTRDTALICIVCITVRFQLYVT